ncbi:methionyl-tRNA formyltransferase [Paenibacillus mesotrionivorans]|uniref:Methionyl-tRNA formyltransferase n=1 Tax=Paenibacillus mesotrionivorans TaxID=3160968 RepID=A0ACC7NZK7_9BACL
MKDTLRIIFMGTPDFAVPSLQVLLEEGYQVVLAVTQPDRPKGRKRVLTPPPVKEAALRAGIPVFQPERIRREEAIRQVAEYKPDLIVTAAFGQFLPKAVLEMPRYGCINVHASLLPKYRGGAPIHHAVMAGEAETGVTLIYMAEGMDTGDMISRVAIPIRDEDNTGILFDKLAREGAELLRRTLPELLAGRIQAEPQKHEEAILSPNIRREDEFVDWNRPARMVWNHIRGLSPWPVASTTWNGENFKLWAARIPEAAQAGGTPALPGTVLAVEDQGILVMAQDGPVLLTEVQPAGKKAMPVSQFRMGSAMKPGDVLGQKEIPNENKPG